MTRTVHDLPTPALLLDRERVERNCARMRQRFDGTGVTLRPHLKTAKAAEVAKLATGEGGPITVSTLAEAAFFAEAGFRDLTWAVTAVPARLASVARIQRSFAATIGLIVDDPGLARALAAEAARLRSRFRVHVEIDSGEHRTGLRPGSTEIVATAAVVHDADTLELAGVLTHGGHAYGAYHAQDLVSIAEEERRAVVDAAAAIRAAGLACPVVSAGSTPTALFARSFEGLTEFRPGVYTLFDLSQQARGCCAADDVAVSVLATVIGCQRRHRRVIIDAGALALSKDQGAADRIPDTGFGWIVGAVGNERIGNLHLEALDQEHGYVTGDPASLAALSPLDRVRVLPNHACITAACHDGFWVVEGQRVVDRWERVTGWEPG